MPLFTRRNNAVDSIDIHPSFDHGSKKYRCLLGRGLHIRTVALVIGCLEVACVAMLIGWASMGYAYYYQHPPIYSGGPTSAPVNSSGVNSSTLQTTTQRPRIIGRPVLIRGVEIPSSNSSILDHVMYAASRAIDSDAVSPHGFIMLLVAAQLVVCVGVTCMLVGIRRANTDLIFVHLVLQVMFGGTVLLAAIIYASTAKAITAVIPYRWMAVLIFALAFVLNASFFAAIYRVYRYANDKRKAIILAQPTEARDDFVVTVI